MTLKQTRTTIKYTSERHKMKLEGEKFQDEHLGVHFMGKVASKISTKIKSLYVYPPIHPQ